MCLRRVEERMATRCRKFVPNLFNKSKCQSCFGAKESHSAEALESSKVILLVPCVDKLA